MINNLHVIKLKWSLGSIPLLCFSIFLCLIPSLKAAQLSVRSYVDRSSIGIGEQFTLAVELSGPSADEVSEPDLPDLSTFADYLGNGTSQSIQFINGKTSSTRTINYYFRARQKGKFEIGPVVIDFAGELYETKPITFEIADRGSSVRSNDRQSTGLSTEDLFLRVEVSRTKVFQNQPTLLTYKIYTRVNVSQYSLHDAPDTVGFWAENLLENQQQAETGYEILNGQRYTVATIWKQVLFPTTPGQRTIKPMKIECEVRVRGNRRGRLDDFFSDPFSSDIFGRSVPYSIESKPVDIEILPLPEEGKPAGFSGVVGDFELSGGVDSTQVMTNDVVTYTVKLVGSGNLRNLRPPNLILSPGIESYDPEETERFRPSINGLTGSKTYKYLLVPRTPGNKTIEEVRFSFFNPESNSYKTQVIAAIDLMVEGSATYSSPSLSSLSKENVRLLAQEIRFIKLDSPQFFDLGFSRFRTPRFWGLILAPLFLIAIAVWFRRHQDKLEGDKAYARRRSAGRQVKQRLKDAHGALRSDNDETFFAECGKALRGFAADKLNLPESAMMSEGVSSILSQKGVGNDIVTEYVKCLETCETRLYSPLKSTVKEREELYRITERTIERLNRELSK